MNHALKVSISLHWLQRQPNQRHFRYKRHLH